MRLQPPCTLGKEKPGPRGPREATGFQGPEAVSGGLNACSLRQWGLGVVDYAAADDAILTVLDGSRFSEQSLKTNDLPRSHQ